MTNIARLANSGSLYEQLIAQTIAIESQPRLELRARQTEQTVFKGVLSDYASRLSALDSALDTLADPLQSAFNARAATVGEEAGFSATASADAAQGDHAVRVLQLAHADARLSKQLAAGGETLIGTFTEPGEPAGPFGVPPATEDEVVARSFTIHLAQDDGSTADVAVSYQPSEGATDDEILGGIAAAINEAVAGADLDDGTGAAASVVRETEGTARLSLRSLATGFGNRLTFSDPNGVLAELEVDQTAERVGTGGGAVRAVGTSAEDSALSAALTLDGLTLYRDANTIDDALDGVTFTLDAADDEARTLTVGPDTDAMRADIDAFINAYNAASRFLSDKTSVNAETGARGAFAGDAGVRGLRAGLRNDLSLETAGAGAFSRLADLGIEADRDGTLSVVDEDALTDALASAPGDVEALFTADDGVASRLRDRIGGLIGASGAIEARKDAVDARVSTLGAQIERWDARLERREESLRAQFALLEEFAVRAQSQQASIQSLFFF